MRFTILACLLASSHAAGKVSVRVYMEFGCHHCRSYLTGPLRSATNDKTTADAVDIDVNPFGNSFYSIPECDTAQQGNESVPGCGGSGGYDVGRRNCFFKECGLGAPRAVNCFAGPLVYQFGFPQMYTTRFAACIKHMAHNDWRSYLPYFLCVEDRYDEIHDGASSSEVAYGCANTSGFDSEELGSCYSSNDPDKYLKDYAVETPDHPGVPYITINGAPQDETHETDALIKAVQHAGKGTSLSIVAKHVPEKALRSSLTTSSAADVSAAKRRITC